MPVRETIFLFFTIQKKFLLEKLKCTFLYYDHPPSPLHTTTKPCTVITYLFLNEYLNNF